MRRRLKPEQRRALILDAAAEEFGRHGHREARMEDVASAAGITKAVLYDHFPSKGALHAEVVRRANDELLASVAGAVAAAADATPRDRYRAGLEAAFDVISRRPDVRTLLLGEPGADIAVARASRGAQRVARKAMAELYLAQPGFLHGVRNRRVRAEHVAQAAIGTINGIAALDDLSPTRQTQLAMDVLWPGIEAMTNR